MPTLEMFCTIEADMQMKVLGKSPAGMRIDFPFEGVATGPHWDGERPVRGVDYSMVRSDGNMDLEIRAVIGDKREAVAYRAYGVSTMNPDQSADINEIITFQTGSEDLEWLNNRVGVAVGGGAAGKLQIDLYLVAR